MWWRLARSAFVKGKGAGNRRALRRIVAAGGVPGLIAYCDGTPAGWCSVAPREDYPVLSRSRVLAPVDDRPVWSIVCFFVAKPFRRTGLTAALIEGALAYAKKRGAAIVEGYPVEPKKGICPTHSPTPGSRRAFAERVSPRSRGGAPRAPSCAIISEKRKHRPDRQEHEPEQDRHEEVDW